MKQKTDTRGVVIPLTGYLQQQQPPTPEHKPVAAIVTPIAIALVAGIGLGALTTHQSSGYQRIQQYKADSAELTKIRKTICY